MVKSVHYDPEADILYIVLREGPAEDTIEIDEDIFVEIDEKGNIIGIEIWQASRNLLDHLSRAIASKIKTTTTNQAEPSPDTAPGHRITPPRSAYCGAAMAHRQEGHSPQQRLGHIFAPG